MLAERSDAEDLPLPETVQGIIAARLDALSVEEKRLLQDASVLGKVFWLGAVSDVSDRHAAELRLHALERKDFIQHARRSSVAGEDEYSFLHVLVRDVAYGQIPRGERAEKHRAVAEWIASLGRSEDHAEMLAHHYSSALELRRAAGQEIDPEFSRQVLECLRDAGERAYSLNAYAAAAGFFASAITLTDHASLERAHLMFRLGRSRYLAGDAEPAQLTEATEALLAAGDRESAAEAEAVLAEAEWLRGDADRSLEHLTRARALVEDVEPSAVKAYVISTVSRYLMLAGQSAEAIAVGREAADMAERLELDEIRAGALNNIGAARCQSGDPGGIDDLEEAVRLADQANAYMEMCRARANLASMLWTRGNLDRSASLRADAQAAALRVGQHQFLRWLRGATAREQYGLGRWGDAEAAVDEFLAEVEAGSPHYLAADNYMVRANIRLGRDDVSGALADVERSLELARLARDRQMLYPTLAVAAEVFMKLDDRDRAAELAAELLSQLVLEPESASLISAELHTLARTLGDLGRGEEMLAVLPADDVPWVHVARALVVGDLRHAADMCRAIGALTEEARDRLWLARSLIELNRRAEAEVALESALAFYRSVGATRYVREGEALLGRSRVDAQSASAG